VTNVSSGQQLGWASSSSATSAIGLGTPVICKAPVVSNPNFWTIAPSGTGYYSFNLSAFPMGLNLPTVSQPVPVAGVGVSGLDSSMWKLLKFDTGNYRIINKDNGLLLLQDSTGKVLLGPGDNKANQQNEWKLDLNPKPSTAVSIPTKSADRELQPTNGKALQFLLMMFADKYRFVPIFQFSIFQRIHNEHSHHRTHSHPERSGGLVCRR
jgi:hypothetical protein